MQLFELHFNLQKSDSPDFISNSFCYTPENFYEKRLGSLLVVGQLQNVLPSNRKFLDNLSAEIKKRYYSSPMKFSAEAALKNSLKKTNEFLEELTRKGEVSWLGNLSLAVFSLVPHKSSKFEVNFTKVGAVKILLLRPSQVIDIGKNLEFSEIEPYPLKIFGNIVSGKLEEQDIIAVLSKEVFEYFSAKQILKELARGFSEKKLKEILKNKEKDFKNISGICLLSVLTKEDWAETKKPKTSFIFQKEAEKFSLTKVFLPMIQPLKKLTYNHSRKNLITVLLFIFLLVLGFLIFR